MPEAWPSMRSTARWVLPVLVGPSTATTREGAWPVERSLMPQMWPETQALATVVNRRRRPQRRPLRHRARRRAGGGSRPRLRRPRRRWLFGARNLSCETRVADRPGVCLARRTRRSDCSKLASDLDIAPRCAVPRSRRSSGRSRASPPARLGRIERVGSRALRRRLVPQLFERLIEGLFNRNGARRIDDIFVVGRDALSAKPPLDGYVSLLQRAKPFADDFALRCILSR